MSESYGYDANRMQLTSQTATKSGGPANGLMNLTYGYNATAGQVGAGSTACNAGQLMAINNNSTINGTAESAAYTYDNLGRLVTSDQTSNGASAQRRFAYDRWGNRTGVWDAASGGNQIQSISLEQSGGAPTNRIQSGSGARTNVALAANGATATASSSYSTNYPPGAAINGDHKGLNVESGGVWIDATTDTFPDWLQVSFNGSKTINEIDVFTLQDALYNPVEPSEGMIFTQQGIVDFQVQYWNGSSWQTVPGGSVAGNNKVWRKFTFSDITTDKIRVNVTGALNSRSRVVEMEAYQATATYGYDATGNVTNDGVHNYAYDAENRLVSVDAGATALYSYDNQNRRYKKVTSGTGTHYIWQGSQVIAEFDSTTRAFIATYLYAGSKMIARQEASAAKYMLSDRLSARLVLDGSGNVIGRQAHLPFGEDFGESGTQEKHHFTSYERDSESGTDYAVNRQYSQVVGRFNRPDPKRSSCQSAGEPQGTNRYAYTRSNPINSSDRLGLDGTPLFPRDPWDPIAPINYGILCQMFPEYCGMSGGDVGLEIIRDVISETGESGGVDDWDFGWSTTMYRYVGKEFVTGAIFRCKYQQDCSVFNSRSTCGHGNHDVYTNNPNRCKPWIKTSQPYAVIAGEVYCMPAGQWEYSMLPVPCT